MLLYITNYRFYPWIPDNSGVEQAAKPLLSKGRLPSEGPPFPDDSG